MEAAAAVQRLERAEQRPEHAEQPGFGDGAGLLVGQAAQGAALVELDRHVGGRVRFPEAMHAHQRRVAELRERARLVDEAAQPGLEGGREPIGTHVHAVVADAPREHRGHVFLDRDLALQRVVVGPVDDAEAAFADHLEQLELIEPVADGQRVRSLLRVGAHRRAGASFRRHSCSSSCIGTLTPMARAPGKKASRTAAC